MEKRKRERRKEKKSGKGFENIEINKQKKEKQMKKLFEKGHWLTTNNCYEILLLKKRDKCKIWKEERKNRKIRGKKKDGLRERDDWILI